MNRISQQLWLPLAFVFVASLTFAQDRIDLRRRQLAQEKARTVANQLVSRVLSLQLQQLRENGLQKLPIYKEIQSMHRNIDGLVGKEMNEVVQLLASAQTQNQKQRRKSVRDARIKIRAIVVRLMAERQKLNRRMRVARIELQVARLIRMQSQVHSTTRLLPEMNNENRETKALKSIQDEKDITALFLRLVETLHEVSSWGGQVGAGAADGIRVVKTAQVRQELAKATKWLSEARFSDSGRSQLAVIKGLRALLEKIQATRGLISSDREAALRMVQEMIRRQEELKQLTAKTKLTDQSVEPLVQKQADIHRQLGKLAAALEKYSATTPLLEQAKASAYEASAKLFEKDKPRTNLEQDKVIGALSQVAQQLKSQINLRQEDLSAKQLANQEKQLTKLAKVLEKAQKQQQQVTKSAAQEPKQALAQEQQVAKDVAKANQQIKELPPTVESRLADAQLAVDQAERKLTVTDPKSAEARQVASRKAQRAIDQALSEVKAQLADTQRRKLAVEVGELARAAEAVERAAAAERAIAKAADDAKENKLAKEDAQGLADDQKTVDDVAKKIAAGVKESAPEAAKTLENAQQPLQQTQRNLEAQAAGKKPAASNKKTAATAKQAAKQLETAAAQIRKKQKEVARQLVKVADKQLKPTVDARRAVENALADQSPNVAIAQQQQRVEQAQKKVAEAQNNQAEAAGKKPLADARRAAQAVDRAAKQQSKAEKAAKDLKEGRANTPLQAATAQQKAADTLADAAKKTKGPVAQALRKAANAAAEAAKATLLDNPTDADAARKEAQSQLNNAKRIAKSDVTKAAKTPASKPNAKAQERVSKQATEAKELAGQAAPQAKATLGKAEQASKSAEKNLQQGDAQQTGKDQQGTQSALTKAAQELQARAKQLAAQQVAKRQQEATATKALAKQAANVDPTAAAALRESARASQRAAQQSEKAQRPPAAEKGLQRAAANLSAREQQIRRDKAIAEAISDLATQQQAARQEIGKQAKALEGKTAKQTKPTSKQIDAARKLRDATEKFAEAQRATGEGAAEISGQQKVANQKIREGLDVASKLNRDVPLPLLKEPEDLGDAAKNLATKTRSTQPPGKGGTPPPNGNSKGKGKGSKQNQAGKQSQQGKPGSKGQPMKGGDPSRQLGNKLVPQSPEATAQQIAGKQALQQAAKALAAAKKAGNGKQSKGPQSPAQDSKNAKAGKSNTAKKSGNDGNSGDKNEKSKEGKLKLNPTPKNNNKGKPNSKKDANLKSRRFLREPWFAKLPPALQQAIQAKTRGRAPRGYEERLRRYFRSIE